jgi:spore germination protein KC
MKRQVSFILCFIMIFMMIPILITGCTPYKELKELEIVEGMGIDKSPDGSFLVTFQGFKASSSGTGGGNQSVSNQTEILQCTGKTLFDASRNFTKQTGKKMYYSNVQALVVGKDVCMSDFSSIMDFLERNHEIAPMERVFMAESKAEDVLTAKNADGFISAKDISLISQNSYNTSMIVDQPLSDIEKKQADGSDFALPVLSIRQGKNQSSSGSSSGGGNDILEIDSTAVFSNDKLAGTLDSNETRGVLWICETVEVKSGVIVVNSTQAGKTSMEIISNTTKQTVTSQGGEPCMNVDINFTTRLTDTQANMASLNENFYKEVKTLQEKAVMDEAESAIKLALRQDKADVFDFGKKIFETKPQLWSKVEKNWRQSMATLPVKVTVHSTIKDNGIISR